MDASVVVCTYNRAGSLARLLTALADQTLAPDQYEIIVVDDGSRDDTSVVCAAFHLRFPNLIYIPLEKNGGLARARNVGIAAATAEFVLFTDDDCVPAGNWIERTCDALKSCPIVAGAVGTPRRPYLVLCHNVAEFHRFMPDLVGGKASFIAGANMGFHRRVLSALDGFDETCRIAEDMEILLRAKSLDYPVFFEPRSVVMHHHGRTRIRELFSYSARHASTSILLRKKYRRLLKTPYALQSSGLLIWCAPLIAGAVLFQIYFRRRRILTLLHTLPVVFGLKLAWCWGAFQGLRDGAGARGNTP